MKKINNIVRIFLFATWSLLVIFGIFSLAEPQWLKDISHQGKIVEASENKLKGDELLRQRNFPAAYNAYSRALEVLPTMQSAQIGRAIALQQQQKFKAAEDIYLKLLKNEPDKPWEVYYNLSAIYEAQRDKPKTINALQNAVKTSPSPFDVYVRLARLHFTSREWQQALEYYQLAFAAKPDSKNSYLDALRTERVIYGKDEELQGIIDEFIKKGYGEEQQELYFSQAFDEQLQSNKVIARIYNDTGFCYAMMGDLPGSLHYFEQAVKLNPSSEEYRQNLKKANHDINIKQGGFMPQGYYLAIDKQAYTMRLYKDKTVQKEYKIATGLNPGDKQEKGDKRTPLGNFKIEKIQPASYWEYDFGDGKGPVAAYGNWFLRLETKADQTLSGKAWTGIGIHGTHDESSIGTRASRGCIRMYNKDLEELVDFLHGLDDYHIPVIIREQLF